MAAKVILAIRAQPLGKAAIAPILGHKTVSGLLHKQIKRLVTDRLTGKGLNLLEQMEE